MTKWLLVGPVVGVALITAALVVGYVLVPPIIVQQVTEVRVKEICRCYLAKEFVELILKVELSLNSMVFFLHVIRGISRKLQVDQTKTSVF